MQATRYLWIYISFSVLIAMFSVWEFLSLFASGNHPILKEALGTKGKSQFAGMKNEAMLAITVLRARK